MRWKTSHLFAIGIALAVALYFIVAGVLGAGGKPAAKAAPAASGSALPSVQATLTEEQVHPVSINVRGRTAALRSVVVKSETAGVVGATPVIQGSLVAKGQVLCRLNVDAREASLAQARAALKSRQLTQQGSVELAKRGYRSQTQVLQDQANLDNAQALVRQAEIALEQTNIRAPFAGVFDHRDAEVGSYLSPGQSCGSVIELDPLLITGDLPETEAGRLKVGAPATARLVSGEVMAGRVRYIAREADPQTRTYRVEIVAPNPGLRVRSGLSATVQVSAGAGPAHLVPVSTLVLDARGRQGLRYVADDGRVAFAPVQPLEETPQGMWVSGLRGPVKVIVVGQSYVDEGQKVRVAMTR